MSTMEPWQTTGPDAGPPAASPSAGAPGSGFGRRAFLGRAVLAGASLPVLQGLLSACGTSNASGTSAVRIPAPDNPIKWPLSTKHPAIKSGLKPKAGSTLRIYNYADYLSPQVIKSFEKATGVTVQVSTYNDQDEALTKIASGDLNFDLYMPSYDSLGKMVTADLLRPLNHDYITNIKNLWPQFLNPWYDQGWRYSVPYTVYTTGIAWRTDMVKEDVGARQNPYDVFWDPKYAGNLAVIDDWHTCMGMVLLRNGVDNINTTNASDIAHMRTELLKLLSVTHPKVTITMYNDLPAGQYGLCQMWSGDVVNAVYYLPKGTSPDVLRYWFPTDGKGMVDNDLMVVLAQGQNPVAAHYFINNMLDSKVAGTNFKYIGYQPPQNSINPEQLVADGFIPKNLKPATVLSKYFTNGYRLLELPPATDSTYHQIWQEFNAGG
ncbi:MAG: polyamine ABC transporter substrate-binding protein [Nocardioidaceae bacterium]